MRIPGPGIGIRNFGATLVAAAMFALAPAAFADEGATSTDTAATAATNATSGAWQVARELASSALDLIGIRYKWGGATPAAGLDCSGLVQFVFQHVTGVTLPRSSKEMSRLGAQVTLADLQPGDLVFFNTRRFAFSHVGIYVGDNRFIHAPRRGREVEVAEIDKTYWQKHFNGARRLVGVLPEMMPKLIADAAAATPVEGDDDLPPAETAAPDSAQR